MRHCLRRAALRVGIGPEAGGGLYKGIKQQPAEGVFFKEKFRMPLHRLYEAPVRHIHGFGEAVRRYCHGRKLPGKAVYALVVAAVYLKNGLSGDPKALVSEPTLSEAEAISSSIPTNGSSL